MLINTKKSIIANSLYSLFHIIKKQIVYRKNNGFNKLIGKQFSRFGHSFATFDCDYYKNNYPDLKNIKDPYAHFVTDGYNQGREGRFFDKTWYKNFHADVCKLGIDSLVHFEKFGKSEGREARYTKISIQNYDPLQINYSKWLFENNNYLSPQKPDILENISNLNFKPLISIILPVFDPNPTLLNEAIKSVMEQTYSNWELCIVDDCSKDKQIKKLILYYSKIDKRIKYKFRDYNGNISEASNMALEIATGEFIGLLDHDDILSRDALYHVITAINENKNVKMLYSDEDKCDILGNRFSPYFKPDFNYELLLSQNMICHFAVYKTSIVKLVGGFRKGYEGAQDYDLALRVVSKINHADIFHIDRVLYHWRSTEGSTSLSLEAKPYAKKAAIKALKDHLDKNNLAADVEEEKEMPGAFRVKYKINDPNTIITIIIPTRDNVELLKRCIDSINEKTTFSNFEIIIIDNLSKKNETNEYLNRIKSDKIKIYKYDFDFNFSKINNFAASKSSGEYLLFLNDDVEVITNNWIEELLSFAQLKDVGCVGAKLYFQDNTIQHAGIVLTNKGIAGHAHKFLNRGKTGYFGRAVLNQEVSAVTAACMLIKKAKFDIIGGFDEKLAVNFNDVDLCLRLKSIGLRIIWTPYAELYHFESKTRGNDKYTNKNNKIISETKYFLKKWNSEDLRDRFYNNNLSKRNFSFTL